MPQYATPAEYTSYTGGTTTDRVLTVASNRIDEVLIGAVYDVDDNDLPTDATILAALKNATCEQALFMDEEGDTSGTGNASTGTLQSASIGSASYSMDATAAAEKRQNTPSGAPIAPGALSILRVEGLLPVWPIACG